MELIEIYGGRDASKEKFKAMARRFRDRPDPPPTLEEITREVEIVRAEMDENRDVERF